jgi:Family of unknown function (DUF6090)
MIKFFRKIRQKTLTENKFGKYLTYAIGEVILVVIGILIALYINNNNVKNQQEKKIVSLLNTILTDLSTDIKNANEVLDFETVQDSILKLVIEDKLTEDSYKNTDYGQYVSSAIYFEISDNAYPNLAEAVNEIPEKYKKAYNTLSILYSEHKPSINKLNEYLLDFVIGIDKKWSSTQSWYSKHITMRYQNRYEPLPEMVQYLLNDKFHKNDAASLLVMLQQHMDAVLKYRHQAVQSYYAIHNVLEETNELPEIITSYMIYLPIDDSLKYEGTYILKDYDGIKVEITYEEGHLNWTQYGGLAGDEGSTIIIFAKSDVEFFEVSSMPIKVFFEENSDGEIIGFSSTLAGQEYNFIKSETAINQ